MKFPFLIKSFSCFFSVGLLALFLLTLRLPVAAQTPTWQSARVVAGASSLSTSGNYSQVRATAVDAAGNVYLAGIFSNTVALGGTTLTSLGSYDVFVAKFNPASNQFVWAQRAGGTGADYANALVVNGSSVYVAGTFSSPMVGFGTTTLPTAGNKDVFVAKLTDTGNTGSFVWAQRAGGTGIDEAYALAVSGTNVYIAGRFESSAADFGSTTLTNTTAGTSEVFVAKLTDVGSIGSFTWAQSVSGTGYDYALALAVSGTSVYVAGSFGSSTIAFGTTVLTNAGTSNVFVAKLTDAGNTGSFVWAQWAGGVGGDSAYALAVSGTSVYIVGSFSSTTADFGSTMLTKSGTDDVFVAKLTDAGSTGSFTWVQRAGGIGDDQGYALAVSGTSVYVTGSFSSSRAGFGSINLTNTNPTYSDVFVAKLTDAGSTGSFTGAQRAGDVGAEVGYALAISGTSVYVAGSFIGYTTSFGPTTLTNPMPGVYLGYLASLTDATLTATTTALSREQTALYPNPAHHTATLRLPAGTAPAPLTLTDALGRTVRRYPAPASPEATLDLRGLPAGLYLLRGGGLDQRLVVE